MDTLQKANQCALLILLACFLAMASACMRFTLQSSAIAGGVTTETALGLYYYRNREWAKAIAIFNKAAAKGDAKAMYYLGCVYWYGSATSTGAGDSKTPALPDDNAAILWWRKAAKLGNADAMDSIAADIYAARAGKPPNLPRAFIWYHRAANGGNADGMAQVGRFYYKGWGTPINYASAYYWMQKAAAAGSPIGAKWLRIHPAP